MSWLNGVTVYREQPPDLQEVTVLRKYTTIDKLASQIDVGLCDASGVMRMSDSHDEEFLEHNKEVTAVLLSQVRRDIGNLAVEVRNGFNVLEARVRELELKDAKSEGAIAGVRGTMMVIATLSSIAGGLIGWVISWFSKK